MRRRIKSLVLIILMISVIFTGCKIEKPDDVAKGGKYATNIENTSKDNSEAKDSTDTKDSKDKKDEKKDSSKDSNKDKKESNNQDKKEDNKQEKKDSSKDGKTKNLNTSGKNVQKGETSTNKGKGKNSGKGTTSKKTRVELVAEANKHRESGTKDQYLTDPTPEGMPKPVEWQGKKIDKSKVRYCTLSVDCLTILNNMKDFNKDKMSVLPRSGIIYKARKVAFYEGESVFDMLNREMKKNRIHMEFSMTPIYNSNYIEGIHNLYEFDCGRYSGWMYKVNGWYPNYGCSRYVLKDGDVVNWRYTCDLGRDLGCTWLGKTKDD